MRLWSLHPRFLDPVGLTAVWREALLAKKVLQGRTRGYRHHPQLDRFRRCGCPLAAIRVYLGGVLREAKRRGYAFNGRKVRPARCPRLPVSRGQVRFERLHLLRKLKQRDPLRYVVLLRQRRITLHPLFRLVPGGMALWEKARSR